MAEKSNPHTIALTASFISSILLAAGLVAGYIQNCSQNTTIDILESTVIDLKARHDKLEQNFKRLEDVEDKQREGSAKREILSPAGGGISVLDLLKQGIRGPPGPPGTSGKDGIPGIPGRDGRDAVNFQHIDRHVNTSVTQAVSSEMKKVADLIKTTPAVSGAVYVRFGRTVCPSKSMLIYKGRIGGTYFSAKGGSSQYICLPDDPEYGEPHPPGKYLTKISGAELHNTNDIMAGKKSRFHNAPCAVCEAGTRPNKLFIPAKMRCPDSSWVLEYRGFIMTEYDNEPDRGRMEYMCMDEDPEIVPGMGAEGFGTMLYHTTIDCKTLGYCPPYQSDRELRCVICSK